MLSVPTKMLTWGRTSPVSVRTRSRTPGYFPASESSASRTLVAVDSLVTRFCPSVKVRRYPGIRNTTAMSGSRAGGRSLFAGRSFLLGGGFGCLALLRLAHETGFQTHHRGQGAGEHLPRTALVARAIEFSAAGAEVDSCRLQGIGGHCVPENGLESIFLRQPLGQRLPSAAPIAGAVDAQLRFGHATELVRLERQRIDRVQIVGMHRHRKSKVRWYAPGDVAPRIAAIVAAVQSEMVLEKQAIRARGVAHHLVHALAKLRILLGQELRPDSLVAGFPRAAAIHRPVNPGGGDRHQHPLGVRRVGDDRMQAQSPASRLPSASMRMIEKSADQRPILA